MINQKKVYKGITPTNNMKKGEFIIDSCKNSINLKSIKFSNITSNKCNHFIVTPQISYSPTFAKVNDE